jgi:hypothetical protein
LRLADILRFLRRLGELRSGDGNEMSWRHSGGNIFCKTSVSISKTESGHEGLLE